MFTEEAIDRIRGRNHSEPLFLYLAYQAVHDANLPDDALQAPQKWLNKFQHIKHLGRRKYAAVMGALDESIGKVIFVFPFLNNKTNIGGSFCLDAQMPLSFV